MIQFEGRSFQRVADFQAAFPAYARLLHYVRAGATSIAEVERMAISARAQNRMANREAIARSGFQPGYGMGHRQA